jgi:hypothetical protein
MLTKSKRSNGEVIVEWSRQGPYQPMIDKLQLLKILFNEIKCYDQVGMLIHSVGSRYDILWVTASFYYQDTKKLYSNYIQDEYNITGIVFVNEVDADKFIEILNKRYVWHLLQN